jgi:hypothetical protein
METAFWSMATGKEWEFGPQVHVSSRMTNDNSTANKGGKFLWRNANVDWSRKYGSDDIKAMDESELVRNMQHKFRRKYDLVVKQGRLQHHYLIT